MRDAVRALRVFLTLFAFASAVTAVLLTPGASRAAMSCTISVSSLAFGSYDVYGPAIDSTAGITGHCSGAMGSGSHTIGITIDGGGHLEGNGNRAMACTSGACAGSPTFSGDLLQYQLYSDSTRLSVWTANTVTINTTCTGCNGAGGSNFVPVTIYGEIPVASVGGANDVAVGTYSDSITVTLNY